MTYKRRGVLHTPKCEIRWANAIRPYDAYTGRDKPCPYIVQHDNEIRKNTYEILPIIFCNK